MSIHQIITFFFSGAFNHNAKVIEDQKGDFIVQNRPRSKSAYLRISDYAPCLKCYGFYRVTTIKAHLNKCCPDKQYSTKDAKLFLASLCSGSSMDDFQSVIKTMSEDDITEIAKSDEIILELGRQLYEAYECTKEVEVSAKMRILGRFLKVMRKVCEDESVGMFDVIKPLMFDNVVLAVKELACLKPGAKESSIPSLALKVGHELKKAAVLVKGIGYRKQEAKLIDDADAYIYLHSTEWPRLISKYSLKALAHKKVTQALPFSSDLQVFLIFLLLLNVGWVYVSSKSCLVQLRFKPRDRPQLIICVLYFRK